MNRHSALTLFELLIVIAVIGVISLPLYFSYTRSQANQSLRSSSEQLKHTIESAHIFAREARDKRSWGVKSINTKSFALVSGKPDSIKTEKITSLEALTQIPQPFEIWFDIGSGDTQNSQTIRITNSYDKSIDLIVSKTGIVDINQVQ